MSGNGLKSDKSKVLNSQGSVLD